MTRFLFLLAILLLRVSAIAQIESTDDLGRTIRLAVPAQRIVSLAPSITESLFAIGAGDQVCAVTDFCTYPDAARRKPHVGGMTTPNIEAVVALHPDLVIMSMEGNTRQAFDRLTELGIPVFVSNPRTLEGILHSLEVLGRVTGKDTDASRFVQRLRSRQDSVAAYVAGRRVRALMVISLEPLIAAGANTFINDLITKAGGINVAATAPGNYPALSREAVLESNPDAVVVTSDLAESAAALLARFPEWSGLNAFRNGHVHRIDPDIVSRPGPRAFDALDSLAHFFHHTHP